MTLAPGARVGSYEILALLGSGGMGEVYRARDAKLNRDVALKVLPELFTADPDRLARFRREAQVLASLNHPNIGHIYGFDDSGDTHALVLELVEGPTLAERIEPGPLALDETLPIARQIADALECAHEQGIVHRDLKPANIKVRPDGTVKVLDFGLAKAFDPATSSGEVLNSPTLTARATQLGVIIGTAAYMAPEQARGRAVDRRADIWAFGVVLFEMLTGRRAFEGEDISVTLAAVLRDDVRWSELPADIPASIRRLLRRCLEKDPKRRLSAIGDARLELEDFAEAPAGAAPFPPVPRRRWLQALPWALSALGIAAALTVTTLWAPWRQTASSPAVRISANLGIEGQLALSPAPAAVISPDGRAAVFVVQSAGRTLLYYRRLDQLHLTPLRGTEEAHGPFFSPDGHWIGFFTPGKMKKIAVTGGATMTICDATVGRGAWWGEDGHIIFQPTAGLGVLLQRVSAAGGTPTPIGKPIPGDSMQRWPQILPGGKAILYGTSAGPTWDGANIVVQPLPGGEPKVILRGGFHARYAAGHLLYLHEGTLFAVNFDLERLAVQGTPAPVIEGVSAPITIGSAQFSISDTGTLLYVPGPTGPTEAPVSWMDRSGKTSVLRAELADWSYPSFSPDGRKLAMTIGFATAADVWIYDWARDALTKFTFGGGVDQAPVWSPDGTRIAYASSPENTTHTNLYWKRADGTGDAQRLTQGAARQTPFAFHRDGKHLAFTERRPDGTLDIMLLPLEGDEKAGWKPGQPEAFLNTPAIETMPAFSPDGRWLAYMSTETAQPEVYVRPFPRGEGRWKISGTPALHPVWSRTRPELLYVVPGSEHAIMAVRYASEGNSFRHERPRPWSPGVLLPVGNSRPYDLHPDGERIAMLKPPDATQRQESPVFVFNFLDELRRTVRAN